MIRRSTLPAAVLLAFLPALGFAEGSRQTPQADPPKQEVPADPVVVKLLGESITEKQVLDTINQIAMQRASSKEATEQQILQKDIVFYKDALDTLIGTVLLKNEAREKHFVVSEAQIEQTLQSMKKQFKDEAQFEQALRVQGVNEKDLRNSIETNLLCQQVLDGIAKELPPPTDAEIKKFYDDNPKSFIEQEQMHAAQIFLKVDKGSTPEQKAAVKQRLEAIRADIEAKKVTFAQAAIKESEDKANGPRGGDLGLFKRDAMLKPLADVAFATKPGTLTPILESDLGYHLIEVIEIKPAGTMSLETATPKIKDFLTRKANQEAVRKHLDALKAKVKIDFVMSDEEWNKRHAAK